MIEILAGVALACIATIVGMFYAYRMGYDDGLDEPRANSYDEGYHDGYEAGVTEGWAKLPRQPKQEALEL